MTKPKIKICGLSREQDIEAVNEVLPDYIGFVFAESRRRINYEQAKTFRRELDARIKAVGVFVNAPLDDIITLCCDNVIDAIQLHGDEDSSYIAALRKEVSHPIIKALRVQNTQQLIESQSLMCDYLLLDTYQKDVYGGSGKSFDRLLIPRMEKPYFLAGGLNVSNITDAVNECHPYCLDVSSGVETNGVKDREKIKEIVRMIRSVN